MVNCKYMKTIIQKDKDKMTKIKKDVPLVNPYVERENKLLKKFGENRLKYLRSSLDMTLIEKISVIDETLTFKDSMGFYTIDTKLNPKPITTLVQSKRDCDLWLKLMNTNSDFKSWFHNFACNMLKMSREHNKDGDVVLYYPDTKHGKLINQHLNYIFNLTKK